MLTSSNPTLTVMQRVAAVLLDKRHRLCSKNVLMNPHTLSDSYRWYSTMYKARWCTSPICPLQVLRLLMEAGADVDARSRWEGLTALHLAAIFGHTEAAHALLEHGASKAICNHSNHTAAKLASMFGQAAFGADLTLLPTIEVSIVSAKRLLSWGLSSGLNSLQRGASVSGKLSGDVTPDCCCEARTPLGIMYVAWNSSEV